MEKTILIKDIRQLDKIAKSLTKNIQYPSVFLLSGELGSGKTTFVKVFAKKLGINKHITSPTFLIHKSYGFNGKILRHYDLYRLSKYNQLQEIGFEEQIGKYIMFIEWPEKIKDLAQKIKKDKNIKKIIKINFYHTNNRNYRKLIIQI